MHRALGSYARSPGGMDEGVSKSARRIGDLVIDEAAHTVCRAGSLVELTRTEFELLLALARHPAQVLSRAQLLGQVWGFDHYGPNLVEVHICSLRKKLEAHGPRLIHTIRSAGYVLRP
jgi:two-component system OmpR family response regulator